MGLMLNLCMLMLSPWLGTVFKMSSLSFIFPEKPVEMKSNSNVSGFKCLQIKSAKPSNQSASSGSVYTCPTQVNYT